MAAEFRGVVKNVTIANDKVKVVVETDKRDVKRILGDIAELEGKDIIAMLRQESYSFKVPYDRDSNLPGIRYEVDETGLVSKIIEEQMQLDIDDKKDAFEDREFVVERDTIDDFILACPQLEFPGKINPKDVIDFMRDEVPLSEIAARHELSESALLNELEIARNYYAPYAAAWADKKEREGFEFNRNAATEKLKEDENRDAEAVETDADESENIEEVPEVGSEEPSSGETESDEQTQSGDDPY